MKRLNKKGMSIVEVVLTFALIMIITTGLLTIVVNYRNKVSVSSQRLLMDTFKDNITQDMYNDMLKHGLKEINEYSEASMNDLADEVKREINATNATVFNDALAMVKEDLQNLTIKNYTGGDTKSVYAKALITKYVSKFGSCLTLKNELNRCINISFQDNSVADKAFGTSIINTDDRDSVENKFLYYDGIKYKISDKLPTEIPKDADGNPRPLKDLQRIIVDDDGILSVDSSVLEDGTKVSIYKIDVKVYHIDFKEDFGVHIVMSNDDLDMNALLANNTTVKDHYDTGEAIYYNVDTGKQCTEEAWNDNVSSWGSHSNFQYVGGKLISGGLELMPTGLHTGCLKFYVIDDTDSKLTLITAFNIDEVGADKYETDTSKYGVRASYWADVKNGSSNMNVKDFNNITNREPNQHYVMEVLKSYTDDWKANFVSQDYTYNYTDENGVAQSYTLPYKSEGYKARLITKAEVETLFTNNEYKKFLTDYLSWKKHPVLYDGYMNGYYTSDAKDNKTMYAVGRYNIDEKDGVTAKEDIYGVRPIITLDKRNLVKVEPYVPIPDVSLPSMAYTKYESGTIMYFNVTTGTECSKEEADKNLSERHTSVGVNSGCMKFYTLADSSNSSTVSLLLDHPITVGPVPWNTAAVSGISGSAMASTYEPTTLLAQIQEDTGDWNGVEIIDNYTTTGIQETSYGDAMYYRLTIPFKDYGIKARLITTQEMDEVFHKYPAYLNSYYDRTVSGTSYHPINPDKRSDLNEGMRSVIGSYDYCYEGIGYYNPECNPYGLMGYNVSEVSWLYSDYQRNYSAGLNEPASEYTDIYDDYELTYDTLGYQGGYWTQTLTSAQTGTGYGMVHFVDGPRWYGPPKEGMQYRPVIEVKKSKFGNMIQEETIETYEGNVVKFKDGLKNATYSITDTDIATIDNKGNITPLTMGITYAYAVKDGKTYYAKVVVNHKPVTYFKNHKSILFNPVKGEECSYTEYFLCSDYSNCKQMLVIGETAEGNYLLASYLSDYYMEDTYQKSWSAKYAIEVDPDGAVAKYGDNAYNHWYRLLEYLANKSKDWKTEPISFDYIDYTTKEYMIPYSKPAYYENGEPVYTKARVFTIEDISKMYENWTTTEYGYPWTNTYELLHETGNATVMYRAYPSEGDRVVGHKAIGYLTNYWSSNYNYNTGTYSRQPNNSLPIVVIEVKKEKIHSMIDGTDTPIVLTSTADVKYLDSWYDWAQTNTDGGEVIVRNNNTVTPVKNGKVILTGTKKPTITYDIAETITVELTVDIKYSCGQVDLCGKTTPACN